LVSIDVANIQSATKSIDIAAYALVDAEIIAALLNRAAASVPIRIYLDRTELESEARGDAMVSHSPLHALLNVPAITIKVKDSSILMHLKSYCVDGLVVRDGSANFSPAGETQQDNSLILTDDPATVALFQAKFESMWSRPDNQTIAQAVSRNPQHSSVPSHRQ
jgi:phosphatidylserine/phosphatidylglycerophosphate/cardiolipin synthase-like enzyme